MIVNVSVVPSLPSTRVVIVNLVRQSVLDHLKVFPDARTTAAFDTLGEFLASVPPFKPSSVQETLRPGARYDQRQRNKRG
jgi:hypothetical protein